METMLLKEAVERLSREAQDLQMAKCHFEAILKSTSEGILVLDSGGGITVINPSAKRMMGIEEDLRLKTED